MKCACRARQQPQPTRLSNRIAELCSTESMRGRGRRVHRRRAVPSAAHGVRGAVLGSCRAGGLPPRPLPPRPAPLLRPRAARAYPRTALLPLRRPRVRRAPAPDLRALLRFLRAWPGATFLPRALRCLRAQPDLQVPEEVEWGEGGEGTHGRGSEPLVAHSPPSGRAVQAPPPGLPGLLRDHSQQP